MENIEVARRKFSELSQARDMAAYGVVGGTRILLNSIAKEQEQTNAVMAAINRDIMIAVAEVVRQSLAEYDAAHLALEQSGRSDTLTPEEDAAWDDAQAANEKTK